MSNRQMPSPVQANKAQGADKAPEQIVQAPQVDKQPEVKQPDVKPEAQPSGMEVVAMRDGFMFNTRIKEGDKFSIKSEEQFGSWFRCLDPKMEEKRIKYLEDKKKRAKKKK